MKEGKRKAHMAEKEGGVLDVGRWSGGGDLRGGTREGLVVSAHEKLEHGGLDAVYYEMRERWYWAGMREAEVMKEMQDKQQEEDGWMWECADDEGAEEGGAGQMDTREIRADGDRLLLLRG